MSSDSLTHTLARFAADLKLTHVPDVVREQIKLHLIDALACGLASTRSELAVRFQQHCIEEYAAGPCALLGTSVRLAPVGAALYNGMAINALDHDDGFEVDGRGMGHPGASLVASALSGIWLRKTSGVELLEALIAAYEINARVIIAVQPSIERFRQVYGVCQHQALGAAVAFGKLMQLEPASLENALGLAGTLTPLPSLRKYNWESRPLVSFKDFTAPAAEAGVRAVRLQQHQWVGAQSVLDGDQGLWRMLGSDRFDPNQLIADLGSEWLAANASLKHYPACRWIHTALESFEQLQSSHSFHASAISEIRVLTGTTQARDFMDKRPANEVDAQFSLPHTMACLALGIAKQDWHTARTLNDPQIQALADRVVAEVDPELNALMADTRRPAGQVQVRLGEELITGLRLDYPLGCRERPLSHEQVADKFRQYAPLGGAAHNVELILAGLFAIEECEDVAVLLEGLSGPDSPHSGAGGS
ncbi:MmgE/PrpD family protein [Pseudomonas sp. CDFA 553]|uniref:MmgE/PrpD family protein n=1 Tax=Pseudomonas quasicaspiana TaxID=2829821 RepID=UPI001E29A7A7|nr:MmgE/PrpD family protein [Pseudomonas quasicaspiana]MCD5989811.1 MmgE/PrpD family protein [Pseudomonas quasicaspiana]